MCIKLCSETCAGIMSPTTPREPEKLRYRDMREPEKLRYRDMRDPRYRDSSSPEKPRYDDRGQQRLYASRHDAPTEDAGRDSCPEKRPSHRRRQPRFLDRESQI
jgi:hypothetical protein